MKILNSKIGGREFTGTICPIRSYPGKLISRDSSQVGQKKNKLFFHKVLYINLLSLIFVHTKTNNEMEKINVVQTRYKNLTNGMRGTFKLSDGTKTKFEVFENGEVKQSGTTEANLSVTFPHLIELVHFFTNQ
jgi:hypothetical protein